MQTIISIKESEREKFVQQPQVQLNVNRLCFYLKMGQDTPTKYRCVCEISSIAAKDYADLFLLPTFMGWFYLGLSLRLLSVTLAIWETL